MLKNIFITFATSILLCSCVSQSEHDKIISEKDAIAQERDKFKQELDEIKFGAPNLLSDGKKFYEAKDFTQSRQKFQMLLDKHPDMPQSIEAKKYLNSIDEEELWNNASNSEDITISESYISKYPTGKYISKVNARRIELKILNMQKAYDLASSQNTSYSWKKFLEDYPNHDEASAIRKRIIRLEVDEISGDKETGQMPTFNQYGSGYSSSSTVRITNNTGCELTVRYSGPDVEMILIPVGSTRSVSLSSGSYKIAASACGTNYAGSESLQGEYGSTFYISTTRY
jgi:hypothetical protein